MIFLLFVLERSCSRNDFGKESCKMANTNLLKFVKKY